MEAQERKQLFTFTFNIMTSTLSITTKITLYILFHNYLILQWNVWNGIEHFQWNVLVKSCSKL